MVTALTAPDCQRRAACGGHGLSRVVALRRRAASTGWRRRNRRPEARPLLYRRRRAAAPGTPQPCRERRARLGARSPLRPAWERRRRGWRVAAAFSAWRTVSAVWWTVVTARRTAVLSVPVCRTAERHRLNGLVVTDNLPLLWSAAILRISDQTSRQLPSARPCPLWVHRYRSPAKFARVQSASRHSLRIICKVVGEERPALMVIEMVIR